MLYRIEVLYTNKDLRDYIAEIHGLFNLLWILDESETVEAFRVKGYCARDFGYGPFDKWVNEFDYGEKKCQHSE